MSKEEAIQASIMDFDSWELDPNAKYFHMCNNETISGYQFDQKLMKQMIDKVKSVQNDPIISCDMSSVIGSQDLTKDGLSWDDFGVVYAGASKNFGHAGLCFLIVRDDVLRHAAEVTKRSKLPMPVMMDWEALAACPDFFVNTPSNLSVYITGLMCEHYLKQGGISRYENLAEKRAKLFYDYLDNSSKIAFNNEDGNNLVFANSVHERLRSRMNIPFALQTADGEAATPEQLQ